MKVEKTKWSEKLERTAINADRLNWCLDSFGLTLEELAGGVSISLKTLKSAVEGEAALTIGQLKKLSIYFGKSMLFFVNPASVDEEKILSAQFRTISNRRPVHDRKLRAGEESTGILSPEFME